jgi:hypothetical protein
MSDLIDATLKNLLAGRKPGPKFVGWKKRLLLEAYNL